MKTVAIIPAAGSGVRFGAKTPKQFEMLGGVPILVHTLRVFDAAPEVHAIVLAVRKDDRQRVIDLLSDYEITSDTAIVEGGSERQHSIYNALRAEVAENADIVLVHDGVRPLATAELIARVIREVQEFGAVAPGLPVKDTLKMIDENSVAIETLDRSRIMAIQTPQGFCRNILVQAYEKAREEGFLGTDDAVVVERAGYNVRITAGLQENVKITTPSDLVVAEMLMARHR